MRVAFSGNRFGSRARAGLPTTAVNILATRNSRAMGAGLSAPPEWPTVGLTPSR
jgi:hypothetical protein